MTITIRLFYIIINNNFICIKNKQTIYKIYETQLQ